MLAAPVTVSLSSHVAGTSPVALTLSATASLQCGWPGPELGVVFPSAERLPNTIPRPAVMVDGKQPAAVTRSGRTVTLSVPRPQVLCDAIGPAPVRITFTRAAGLGNPTRAGTYSITVEHGARTARGSFAIRR
jgi:hypothetical protein